MKWAFRLVAVVGILIAVVMIAAASSYEVRRKLRAGIAKIERAFSPSDRR
jgi:hypothetical protein